MGDIDFFSLFSIEVITLEDKKKKWKEKIKKGGIKMTDVYFRDLSEDMQNELVRDLKRLSKHEILKAIHDGESDIIVGKYLPTKLVKLA